MGTILEMTDQEYEEFRKKEINDRKNKINYILTMLNENKKDFIDFIKENETISNFINDDEEIYIIKNKIYEGSEESIFCYENFDELRLFNIVLISMLKNDGSYYNNNDGLLTTDGILYCLWFIYESNKIDAINFIDAFLENEKIKKSIDSLQISNYALIDYLIDNDIDVLKECKNFLGL